MTLNQHPLYLQASPDDRLIVSRSDFLDRLAQIGACQELLAMQAGARRLSAWVNAAEPCSDLVPDEVERPSMIEMSRQWLLEDLQQIEEAQTLERGRYYLERMRRGAIEVRTSRLNDINLNRWKEYDDIITDSLWILSKRDSSGAHTSEYWGNFIPQIPNQLMRRFTRSGEWVLDTFLGQGTTLIESQRLGRNAIGIELQVDVAESAARALSSEPNVHSVISRVVQGDSAQLDLTALLREHGQSSVQLIIMHPPYADIIRFSDDPRDLSCAPTVDSYLEMLNKVVDNAAKVLDEGRYLCLVIGDKYSRGEWVPLGFMAMNEILKRGDFILKSIVVKNFEGTLGKRQQRKLWRYRALAGGFYVFKHEYIHLFCKKSSRPKRSRAQSPANNSEGIPAG